MDFMYSVLTGNCLGNCEGACYCPCSRTTGHHTMSPVGSPTQTPGVSSSHLPCVPINPDGPEGSKLKIMPGIPGIPGLTEVPSLPPLPSALPSEEFMEGQNWSFIIFTGVGVGLAMLGAAAYFCSSSSQRCACQKKRNTVTLHQLPRGKLAPSINCFSLKVETYLRITKIPYENVFEEPFAPGSRYSWVSVGDQEISDSQEAIEFLDKRFHKRLSAHLSDEEVAIGRLVQLMAEHHLLWGILLWRFIHTDLNTAPLIMNPTWRLRLAFWRWKMAVKRSSRIQGLGGRSQEDVEQIALQDLWCLSLALGSKDYFSGSNPTEVDCAVFGVLAQVMWNMPGSIHEKVIQEELINLSNFCLRMKYNYWSDWDSCLDKFSDGGVSSHEELQEFQGMISPVVSLPQSLVGSSTDTSDISI